MSWEDVERSFDHMRPEDIVVHLDLSHFSELVGRVASQTHRLTGLDQFDPNSEEARLLVIDAWRYACHMADRAEFVAQTERDLAALDEPEAPPSEAQHLPEFGGVAQLPNAPEELNRRLQPPV